jgi:protein-disulfide isomerase
MKQGRKVLTLCAALALVAVTAAALPALAARKSEASATSASARAKQTTRQFTGVVTALDKTNLTVEKGGKKPSTMVFTRHAEMRTVGDLEKDARVTVYYRAEGRETVAMRVVVKPAKDGASER